MPASWAWTTLGYISNYGDCNTISIVNITDNEWVLELEDLEKDTATIIQFLTKKDRNIKGVRHRFNKGDVLYSKLRTYLNKVLVAPRDGYCTTEIIPFHSCCDISTNYLSHVLRSMYFLNYTQQCGYGMKMPRLSTNDACKGMIPLPPLAEQKRIVAEIERWFSLIDQIEQGKADLQTAIKQIKSKILDLAIHGKLVPQDPNDEPASELLKRINPQAKITCDNGHDRKLPQGWCSCSYENIFSDISSKPFQILQSQIQSTGDHPVVSQSMKFIEGFSDSKNVFKSNTPCIIFGDHTRNVKYVDFDFIVGADGVKILCPKVNVKWAYYAILYVSLHIENRGYGRHFGQIMKFKYALPPLAEQQRIVQKIEEIFSTLDNIQQSLEV